MILFTCFESEGSSSGTYRVRINYRRISLRHKCRKIVKFVSITHSERIVWNGPIVATAISRESVNQCWREMAASPIERSWCVLESARCNSFVAVQRAFRRQFGRLGPSETSIRRWYEQFPYRGCICHQGKGRAGRPSVTEETVDRVRETFTRSPRKSVRRASRELKIPEPTARKIYGNDRSCNRTNCNWYKNSSLMIHPSSWRFVRTC